MAWYPVLNEIILIGSNRPIDINFYQFEERLQNPVTNKIMPYFLGLSVFETLKVKVFKIVNLVECLSEIEE